MFPFVSAHTQHPSGTVGDALSSLLRVKFPGSAVLMPHEEVHLPSTLLATALKLCPVVGSQGRTAFCIPLGGMS